MTANLYPIPKVRPGYKLALALIGTRKQAYSAYIECPVWCDEQHDESPTMFEDITHTSKFVDVGIASFLKPNGDLLMWAALQCDPVSDDPRQRQAHIGVEAGGMPDYHTPEMAERFADDLIAFASQVRQLARTARAHNAGAGADSDPNMDEALRRVREGGAV